uniref:ATP synthase F0 subunit 8 n=1 Tax=Epeurysa nawaii TaxID=1308479 RepID=A0A7S4YZ56_9HEMI|nr:ATP synthase F0 subunit 8 [Epeurysa nawaii]QBZ37994.1 ATP synthase F0 subunit 8 [Epeurysa nawaii]QBZ38007.1 ATP synthase F0 subunit 8 [Epeurysa nawaii]
MPQMSPCSWIMLLLISILMVNLIKMNMFFEKKKL